jgi:ATP-dependent Clp protease, protease subunit
LLAFTPSASAEEVRNVRVTLTADNTLVLNEQFNSRTTAQLVQDAIEMDARLPSKEPIFLVLNSPGGSISAGLNAIDNLRNLNRPVHTITTFSASMGFHTVQGLGHRLILEDGTLMSHKAWGVFRGEFPGQIDSRYSYWINRVTRMDERVVERTNGKHTLLSYQRLIENEYYCDGAECVRQGFADAIVRAKCDSSLSGTYNKVVDRMRFAGKLFELVVVFPECPVNTGYLAIDVHVNGQSLYGTIVDSSTPVFTNERYNYTTGQMVPILTDEQIDTIKTMTQEKLENLTTNKVVVSP